MKNIPIFDTYEDTRSKAISKIKKAADNSDSEILEELSESLDEKKKATRDVNCQAIRMIVDKCLDSYMEGEYEFKETKRMICEGVEAL